MGYITKPRMGVAGPMALYIIRMILCPMPSPPTPQRLV